MKKIIKILLALSLIAAIGGIVYYKFSPSESSFIINGTLLPFDDARDTQEILNIFKKDRYWLVASEDYSPEFMLKNRAPGQREPKYMGALTIKVLYDTANHFVGFIAYYMKNFFNGQILFIDVKEEYRGKGYAQQLLRYAINDLKRHGASLVTLVTRTDNEVAQRVYLKTGFKESYRDDGYVYFEIRP